MIVWIALIPIVWLSMQQDTLTDITLIRQAIDLKILYSGPRFGLARPHLLFGVVVFFLLWNIGR